MNENRKHINTAQTKKTLMALSRDLRNGKFTCVSDETLDKVADKYVAGLRQLVTEHPSVGKTL